jgi:hypothetical protein
VSNLPDDTNTVRILDVSVRMQNIFEQLGIRTLRDLYKVGEEGLRKHKGCTGKTLGGLRKALKAKGLPTLLKLEQPMKFSFTLTTAQAKKLNAWQKRHKHAKETQPAIGGKLTYSFTPTGVGVVMAVTCACGKTLDFSDYDSW